MAAKAAGAASTPGKLAIPAQSFAGTHGNLQSLEGSSKRYTRVTFDQLSSADFQNDVEFERLNVDLGRTAKPTEKLWPVVAPSPELFGAVAGWRLVEPGMPSVDASESQPDDMVRDRNVYEPYRYMFSPLHERASALAQRADEMAAALRRTYGNAQLANMSVGRICPEADAHRINKASVMLELQDGSAGAGSSAGRLTLDFQETAAYSIFSGQIVGVSGVSLREGVVNVNQIAYRAPPPPVRIRRENAIALAGLRMNSGPLKVIVAAGPFTDPKNLEFEPLSALLTKVTEERADVLVLTGPFVDADHEMVRSGAPTMNIDGNDEDLSLRQVWEELFLSVLNLCLPDSALPNIQIVLQPSTADCVGAEPVFPQWPFASSSLALLDATIRNRVLLVGNPSSFVVGDMLWGMTPMDPVAGMNTDDASDLSGTPDKGMDRYTLLARHVIDQRSYYPLFPAAMPPIAAGKPPGLATDMEQAMKAVPLEVTRLWNLGLPACPDVLVLPSRVGFPQVRPLGEHTVLINPGHLATKRTYARVLVFPDLTVGGEDTKGQEYVTNRAQLRVRVDIERIAKEDL